MPDPARLRRAPDRLQFWGALNGRMSVSTSNEGDAGCLPSDVPLRVRSCVGRIERQVGRVVEGAVVGSDGRGTRYVGAGDLRSLVQSRGVDRQVAPTWRRRVWESRVMRDAVLQVLQRDAPKAHRDAAFAVGGLVDDDEAF